MRVIGKDTSSSLKAPIPELPIKRKRGADPSVTIASDFELSSDDTPVRASRPIRVRQPPKNYKPPPATTRSNKGKQSVNGTRKKAQSKNGGATLPPSESQLRGFLDFPDPEHKARYDKLVLRPFSPYKAFHGLTFNTMGISEEASTYLDNIGWGKLWDYDYPTYVELTYEFFATFRCDGRKQFTWDTKDMIQFRLMDKEFSWSYRQFNVALGVMETDLGASPELVEPFGDFPQEFYNDAPPFWRELTGHNPAAGRYDSRFSKALFIVDHSLRIIHKWLAFSLFPRPHGANLVTKTDLFLLWCMKKGKRADFARWLVRAIKSVIKSFDQPKKRNLSFGSFITAIAVHEELIDEFDTDLHVRCKAEFLDTTFLTKHNILRLNKDKVLEFVPPGETVRDKHEKKGDHAVFGDSEDDAYADIAEIGAQLSTLSTQMVDLTAKVDTMATVQTSILDNQEKMLKLLSNVAASVGPVPPPTS